MKTILIAAGTICGRISPPGFGSLLDRRRLEEARDRTGASIVGANTLRSENPEMRGTNGSLAPNRIRCVISRSGFVPVAGKNLFEHGPTPVVFTGEDNFSALQARLEDRGLAVSLPPGEHGLSLAAAFDYLAERGVRSVLLEGGAQLNYAALAAGLVDEIILTVMPYVSGDSNGAAFADGPVPLGDPFLQLELLSCEPVSTGELFLHYRTRKTD